MNGIAYTADIAALGWYVDSGVNEVLSDAPQDRTKPVEMPVQPVSMPSASRMQGDAPAAAFLGKTDAYEEALKLAQAANTLEDLAKAIAGFDGVAIKKTATNMVFSDGNPKARVMLVGEAPGADEDRQGKPFVGVSGQLLDRILECIDLDRKEEDPAKSVYISNILNWRPPGNRTPNEAEIAVSLPFIEKHIQLIQPEIIILCGGVSAKSLLGSAESISRLRNRWHDYKPQTQGLVANAKPIHAIATYHPSFLLRTPSQKKAVWKDVIEIAGKIKK